jgi:hypothetical protein
MERFRYLKILDSIIGVERPQRKTEYWLLPTTVPRLKMPGILQNKKEKKEKNIDVGFYGVKITN